MKLIRSTGRELTVRDVGPVLARYVPIEDRAAVKQNGWQIVEDEEARELVRALLTTGAYKRVVE